MVTQKVDLYNIQSEILNRLENSGWKSILYEYLEDERFMKILKHLLNETENKRRFTPKIKQLFTAFEECPYKETKVVIIGQDSYPYPGVADGMAFSCSNTGRIQASLKYMYKEIQRTVYNNEQMDWNPDLRCWANQGVLLINASFTTQVDKVGMHYPIWKEFLEFLMGKFNEMPPMAFFLLGKKAQEFKNLLSYNHEIIEASHPATAGYTKTFEWDCSDGFNKVNQFLKKQYNQQIKW